MTVSNRIHNALVKLQYLYREDFVTNEDLDEFFQKINAHRAKHGFALITRQDFDRYLGMKLHYHRAWNAIAFLAVKFASEPKAKVAGVGR